MIAWYVTPRVYERGSRLTPQLFFDDEHRNFEVEQLGVTMQFITNGTNRAVFNEGLEKWRRRQGIKIERMQTSL